MTERPLTESQHLTEITGNAFPLVELLQLTGCCD